MAFETSFYAKGDVIDHTPASDVAAGQIVDLGDRLAIASLKILSGVLGALGIKGIYSVAQVAEIIAEGVPVYWDEDGDPVGGTAGTGAATIDGSKGKYLGLSVGADTAATSTTVKVDLNALIPANAIPAAQQDKVFETVSDNITLDAQDVGKVMNVDTDAKVVTLPATVIGLVYVIRNAGADGAVLVTIAPNAADKIMGADLAGVDDKDHLNTKATAIQGDYTVLRADGVSGWYIEAQRGIWAEEA